jgi:hypothetical protein
VALQLVTCTQCGFSGAAVYEESRRGALDSEAWNHRGYRLSEHGLRTLREAMLACPAPRDSGCECATHRTLAARDEAGGWPGVLASEGVFTVTVA